MSHLTIGQSIAISSPYLIDGFDRTEKGSWKWSVDNELIAKLSDMQDGTAILSAIAAGDVTVSYEALGVNELGESVVIKNTKIFTVTDKPKEKPVMKEITTDFVVIES